MATLFKGVGATGGTPKSVFAYATATTRYMTFEYPAGTDYQVTAGKTFKISRIIFSRDSATVTAGYSIGYGDDAIAEGAAEPTTPVYILGNATVDYWWTTNAETVIQRVHDTYAEVPAGKYPFIKSYTGACFATLIGIEE